MVALKIPLFSGMVPSIDSHLLADQNAAFSENTWLYSGALNGMPKKVPLYTLLSSVATIAFRIPVDTNPTYIYNGKWVEFANQNTDFISAPVSGDSYKRYYWTSSSQDPEYNTTDRIVAGLPAWKLGLPRPADLVVVATGGASATLVSRAYVATLVSEYGEEGPASNPFLISNAKIDATFAVTIPAVTASDLGVTRNVKKIRLYRTITSALGTTTYYQVAEVTALVTSQSYNDTMSDAVLASKPILESSAWTAPPSLNGFAVMPNGIIAGFLDKELYFSEPYRPHAWPVAYSISLEHEIVGMAVINQTLVVCTKGNPVTASGVNPSSITTAKLAAFEPCMAKGSIVATEEGVLYASPNGLIAVNAGFAQNITKQYISKDQWIDYVNQGKVNAGRLGGAYYAFGVGVPNAFNGNAFQNNAFSLGEVGDGDGFLLDPSNTNVGFSFLSSATEIQSVRNDQFSGEILVVSKGVVYWLDQGTGYKTEPYKWKSKIFQTPELKNFSAFKLYLYDDPTFQHPDPQNFDINQVFNPTKQLGVIRIYADGRLILCYEFRKSGQLMRMPTGFTAEFWQIEIEANVRVKSFQMATSVKELSLA